MKITRTFCLLPLFLVFDFADSPCPGLPPGGAGSKTEGIRSSRPAGLHDSVKTQPTNAAKPSGREKREYGFRLINLSTAPAFTTVENMEGGQRCLLPQQEARMQGSFQNRSHYFQEPLPNRLSGKLLLHLLFSRAGAAADRRGRSANAAQILQSEN